LARFGLRARYFHRLLADRARLGFLPFGSAALPKVTSFQTSLRGLAASPGSAGASSCSDTCDPCPADCGQSHCPPRCFLLIALAQLFDALRSGQSTSRRVLTLVLGATATVAAISCWVALEQLSFIPARRLSDLAAVAAGRHLRTRYPDWGEFAVHRHWRSQCTKPCGKRFSLCRANRPETLTVAPSGRYHSLQPAPTSAR
jgi:hypothetical protein